MTTVDETAKRYASMSVNEPRTYSRDNNRFISDVVRSKIFHDSDARERLSRHEAEERANRPGMFKRSSSGVGTGAFSGLTVPQFMLQDVALSVQPGRPLADAVNRQPLPDQGMSIDVPRVSTATTSALQTSELGAVSFTDSSVGFVSCPVNTVAGEAVVSRQLFDRANVAASVIMSDLKLSYNQALDSLLINQATTGLSAVAQSISYTDSTATALELYPLIVRAAAFSQRALLGLGRPDICVMRSDLFYFLEESEGSTWPEFATPDPRAATANYGPGYAGTLPCGLALILDDSITTTATAGGGTNETEVYVGYSREGWLFEDTNAPMFISADQISAGNADITLVMYGYASYCFSRQPNIWSKVVGTGLSGDTL